MKDRLKRKLKAKKIVNQIKTDKPKIYEMPDEYKQNLQHLSEFLQQREDVKEVFSLLRDEDKIIAVDTLKDFDKNIEIIERELAAEYEAYQTKMRNEEEIERLFAKLENTSEELYIIVKRDTPHLFEEFHKIATQDMNEEEIQEFLDRIAVREANFSKTLLALPVIE